MWVRATHKTGLMLFSFSPIKYTVDFKYKDAGRRDYCVLKKAIIIRELQHFTVFGKLSLAFLKRFGAELGRKGRSKVGKDNVMITIVIIKNYLILALSVDLDTPQ